MKKAFVVYHRGLIKPMSKILGPDWEVFVRGENLDKILGKRFSVVVLCQRWYEGLDIQAGHAWVDMLKYNCDEMIYL